MGNRVHVAVPRRAGLLALLACCLLLSWAPLGACQQAHATAAGLEHKKHEHPHGHGDPPEELDCGDVAKLPPGQDRCAFVREHCTDHSGLLNYPRIYYCGFAQHGLLLKALMVALCTALLALLFRIIARASDDFFSCILSQISQDLGLPPRLGGVTLLALGNGAPDLSASIEAVKAGDYQLAMGALTGAGMFVGAVVAGRIVTLNGGVRARGAQIRDISTQFITVAVVTGIVVSGWFTYGSVGLLLSIYAAYVVVVAVADFSKRMGVEWGELALNVSRRVSHRWRRLEMTAPLLREDFGTGGAAALAPAGAPTRSPSPPAGTLFPSRQLAATGSGGSSRLQPTPEEGEAEADEQLQQQGRGGGGVPGWPGAAGVMPAGSPGAARAPLPLGLAGSLPQDLESSVTAAAAADAGGSAQQDSSWLPLGARGAPPFASLPDLHAETRRQQHHQHQQHLRHSPPVAHFQPHLTHGDIMHMSAREYRQRALAEMAQSKSFFARQDGRVEEEDRSDSDSDGENSFGGWDEEGGRPSPRRWGEQGRGGDASSPQHPGMQRLRTFQRSGGIGGGASEGEYRPPVVSLNSTLLAAREAVAEFDAEQAAAAATAAAAAAKPTATEAAGGAELGVIGGTATAAGPGAAAPPPAAAEGPAADGGSGGWLPPPQDFPHPAQPRQISTHASSGSRASASTHQFSVASLEVAPPAGASSAELAQQQGAATSAGERQGQGPQGPLMHALEAVQWPLLFLLQATIPLVEANSYQRRWFLRSMASSPVFIVAFLGLFTWQALLTALCAGAVLAAASHLGTRQLEGKAPLWTLGTSYPIGAALVAVYGFGVAALWISVFASEIVGLLQFFGMLSKVEPAVLGVTVLAWGNSLMDYINNTAMAGRSGGGNSMAMTACFAGPLFNMLVGLGLGFWALLQENHVKQTAVAMDPVVLVGCLFIMLNCACLVGVSLTHRQWLPAWCGWAMVACYCAYLSSVLVVLLLKGG